MNCAISDELNDLQVQRHLLNRSLFGCDFANTRAAVDNISTDAGCRAILP